METINENVLKNIINKKGFQLLGQIPITEDEYDELIYHTKIRTKYISVQTKVKSDLMLSVALVQIAIRHYKDGKYWQCFLEAIDEELPSAKLNYIGQIFAHTIQEYGLLELERKHNSSQMYVENIKAHAFVTNYYMQGFFDFAYAFFENNLFRELSDDINDDIASLSQFMKSTINSSDEVSSFSVDKKAAKSYKLLKSTREVFAQGEFQTIYSLFFPILEMIDKYFYDNEVPLFPQTRYEIQVIEW